MKTDVYRICKIIATKIKDKNFGELKDILNEEVVVTKEEMIIGPNENYFNVPRNGDILVGFYLEEDKTPIELQITYGGRRLDNITLTPGKCSYFLNNKHMLPIISLYYSEFHITVSRENPVDFTGISCIFSLLQTDLRRALATSPIIFENAFGLITHSHYGDFENLEERNKRIDNIDNIIEFPDMINNEFINNSLLKS